MRHIDKRTRLSRRGFLSTSGAATLGIGALAGGRILIDPRGAWAISLQSLDPETARALVQMARDLYPHDRLTDVYYVKAIEPYDVAASKEPTLRNLLANGTKSLNETAKAKHNTAYADIPDEKDRVAILRGMEQTPFFQKVRSDMIPALYNQPDLWMRFGYEGPSAEYGGYIDRGFNDIDWLPA